MNHKRHRPAKQRAAADCMCNPHQAALGNTRSDYWATREQRREELTVREQMDEVLDTVFEIARERHEGYDG